MRILHTSDWHLGHTLHEHHRRHEHQHFLGWLLDTLESEKVDALIVAGDIFDTSNPPSSAQDMLYRFIAQARTRLPCLDMVFVGGNHDSPSRLDAPHPLLHQLGVVMVGGYVREGGDRMVVPLRGRDGEISAWVAAVPFLRAGDWAGGDDENACGMIEGVRKAYQRVLDKVAEKRRPEHALIATGHCYMTRATLSESSERKIHGGNQHPLPVDIFPDDVDYVALGHLHFAQPVDGREHVRYSGSPIPLSLDERSYHHAVWIVDFEGGRFAGAAERRIPRLVNIVRVPEKGGAATLDEICAELRALAARKPEDDEALLPFLDVHIALPSPRANLRHELDQALEGRAARLARALPHYTGQDEAWNRPGVNLKELHPEEVFQKMYDSRYSEPMPDALRAAFHEILETTQEGRA